MSSSYKYCSAGAWTPLWQAPSFGFVYVWSTSPVPIRWRAFTASPFWYSDGRANINGKTTVGFGIPTPYVQFEVRPDFDALLFAS